MCTCHQQQEQHSISDAVLQPWWHCVRRVGGRVAGEAGQGQVGRRTATWKCAHLAEMLLAGCIGCTPKRGSTLTPDIGRYTTT